jgi:hypothetical protein
MRFFMLRFSKLVLCGVVFTVVLGCGDPVAKSNSKPPADMPSDKPQKATSPPLPPKQGGNTE